MLNSRNAAEARFTSASGRSHRRLRPTAKPVFRGNAQASRWTSSERPTLATVICAGDDLAMASAHRVLQRPGGLGARFAAANAYGVSARPSGLTGCSKPRPGSDRILLAWGGPFALELSSRIPDRQRSRRPNHVSTVPESIAVENPKNFGKRRLYPGRQGELCRRPLRNAPYQVPSISCLLGAAFMTPHPSYTVALSERTATPWASNPSVIIDSTRP